MGRFSRVPGQKILVIYWFFSGIVIPALEFEPFITEF